MGRSDRVTVKCPKCKTELQAPIELAGKRAKCRVCATKMTVPAAPLPDPEPELVPLDDADELAPLDDIDERPRPKRNRGREEEPEYRPRRPRGKDKPIWPWAVGGGVLVGLALVICGYLIFGRSGSGTTKLTLDSIAGDWTATVDDVEYTYSFEKDGVGLIMARGRGQLSIARFEYDVQSFSGKPTLIIKHRDESRCPISLEPDGRLLLEKSFRRERDFKIVAEPISLSKTTKPKDEPLP